MLTTKENDRDAQLRARPMTLVQDAYDGTLFFFSSHSDAKVFEIEHDRDVCVSFSDPNSGVYVSLTGKGNVNTDSTVIDRYWSDDMAAWFEQGKEDPNLAMIEVKISKGEHWNVKENKLAQYLETATDVNINIYAREGFEVYDRMHADGKDPMTVNFLRRLPIKQLTDPDLAEPNHKQMSMANMAD